VWTEGGFPPTDPPTDHRGDHDLRTHPPGETSFGTRINPPFASSPRVHWIGIKQSKSRSDGLLLPTQYNVSIAVTNRERLWKYLPNKYVYNFVRNYSHYLLHKHYGFTKAQHPHPLLATMLATPQRSLSDEPQHLL
jgi:hypothetical protein